MNAKPVDLTKLKPGMRCRMTNGETPVCESCEFDENCNRFYITWATRIIGTGGSDSLTWWYRPDGTWYTESCPGNNIEEILDPHEFIASIPEMEKERASRHNKGKLEWFRLPFDCLEDVVRVMMGGSVKYPDDPVDDTGRGKPNWSKDGTPYTEFAESCQRHLLAWRNGEDTDTESGHPHLAHMIAGALFLMYYQKHGKGVDDRLRSRGL